MNVVQPGHPDRIKSLRESAEVPWTWRYLEISGGSGGYSGIASSCLLRRFPT